MLSIFLSAFISFSPNFNRLVDGDLKRRAYSNAINYSLKYGQLGIRANTLSIPPATSSPNTKNVTLPLKAKRAGSDASWTNQSHIDSTITITEDSQIQVNLTQEFTND